ncbi:MAG: ankyrin repeat domain-containing protein [Alphaproteobacteria bacterium]
MPSDYQIKLGQDLLKELTNQHPDFDTLRDYLKSKADLSQTDRHGNTALQLVVTWGNIALMKQMIDGGVDVNHKGTGGNTALHTAVALRSKSTIKLLIDNGADAGIANDNGQTPVDCARGWDDADLADSVQAKFNKVSAAKKEKADYEHSVNNGMPVLEPFQPLKQIQLRKP